MERRKRFGTWCGKNINDMRTIHYTFKCDGEVKKFTSDDDVSFSMLMRIADAWIESIELVDNEWFVVIYED